MIDLEDVLHGTPTLKEVGEFFSKGEFHSGRNFNQAVRKYLMTHKDKINLDQRGISLTDALKYDIDPRHETFIHNLFQSWNKKLGVKAFY